MPTESQYVAASEITKHFENMLRGDNFSANVIKSVVAYFVKKYLYIRLRHICAEDVVQDIFVKFYTKSKYVRSRSNAAHYISIVCKSHIFDLLRTHTRQNKHLPKYARERSENNLSDVAKAIQNKEIAIRATEIVFNNIPDYAQGASAYLMLHIPYGLSMEQVALASGTKVNTVKTQALRYRKKCRSKYETDFND
jgi:RNA polymerase sigma factor (sigma-70 family)